MLSASGDQRCEAPAPSAGQRISPPAECLSYSRPTIAGLGAVFVGDNADPEVADSRSGHTAGSRQSLLRAVDLCYAPLIEIAGSSTLPAAGVCIRSEIALGGRHEIFRIIDPAVTFVNQNEMEPSSNARMVGSAQR